MEKSSQGREAADDKRIYTILAIFGLATLLLILIIGNLMGALPDFLYASIAYSI